MLDRAVRAGWLSLAALSLAGCSHAIRESSGAGSRPNLVVIMADDLGYGDLDRARTPNLDRMAAEGLRFTDFHASGPVCSPTRAGLVTGRYQQRAGIPGVVVADPAQPAHYHGLQPQELTFAELLEGAGYATALFGKWHLGYERQYNPAFHGFGRFRGFLSGNVDYHSHVDQAGAADWWDDTELIEEEGYTTHLLGKHAVRFVEQNRNRPFLLYIAHEAPHYPYQTPADGPFRTAGVPARDPMPGNVRQVYDTMVEEMDRSIGEVIDAIRRLGLERNTLVLFLSDNGAVPHGSNGGLRGFKGQLWEGGHRVPAIAWWPGRIPPGTSTDQLAISLDVFPTLLGVAGVPVPPGHRIDGTNLLPVLAGGRLAQERTLFWEFGRQWAVRQGPWKLVQGAPGLKDGELGLFNLAEDRAESRNVATLHPERAAALRTAFEAWHADVAASATQQPEKRALSR